LIRGVLFDSGGTLVGPVGGRWNPRFDFEEVVLHHVPDVEVRRFRQAFEAGERHLATAPPSAPRDDYHRVVLAALDIPAPSRALLHDLARPLDVPVLEPFAEVPDVLDALRRKGVRMAVVTDNTPEIDALYEQIGLRSLFDAFVISAELGCRKPDPRMYRAGSEALALQPGECLFVDDDPDLVAAAIGLGYEGRAIRRSDGESPSDVPVITDLREVVDLVGG
jgi:putative hydrolase of the HAD superfamily